MRKILLYFDPAVQSILVKKKTAEGEVKAALSSRYNFVSEGEIVARVVDLKGDDELESRIDEGYSYYNVQDYFNFEIGPGVFFDESEKAYKASFYGFITLNDQKLKLLSPFSISKDKIKAFYNIYPTKFGQYPPFREIEEILHVEKIVTAVSEDRYNQQINALNADNPRLARVVIAQGRPPVNGYDDYFEPLLSLQKKAGKILSDGRIDYKEVDSIIQVQKNQEILKKIDGIKSEDGYDIYGERVAAVNEPSKGYKKGENLVQSGFDNTIYLAELDGCLNIAKNKVSVLPVAVINGDVDLDKGNIDFNGTVHITGSVKPGFKVKAARDIIIEKDVEDAILSAGGDIEVKLGIVGKESVRLVAGGNVSARFMQNAKVEAVGSVFVHDSIINCDIISYNTISVVNPGGKIIGGKLLALYEINSTVIGTQNETATSLTVGRNLIVEKEMSDKRTEIKIVKERIEEISTNMKMQFGEEIFKNPREYLKILPAAKKKNCLLILNDMGSANNELKKLLADAAVIEKKLKFEKEPVIIVKGKIFPGVVVNVKKSVKKIERAVDNVKFYEDALDKTVRFTSAV